MKRVTFINNDGVMTVWQVKSASWGDQSRNVILYDAKLISMTGKAEVGMTRTVPRALVSLAGVNSMFEEEW